MKRSIKLEHISLLFCSGSLAPPEIARPCVHLELEAKIAVMTTCTACNVTVVQRISDMAPTNNVICVHLTELHISVYD